MTDFAEMRYEQRCTKKRARRAKIRQFRTRRRVRANADVARRAGEKTFSVCTGARVQSFTVRVVVKRARTLRVSCV